MPDFDFEAVFSGELDKAVAEGQAGSPFLVEDWFVAGFRPRQDLDWWHQEGPGMCRAYAEWYDANPDVSVWYTPDGIPAIELPLVVQFGEITVRMVIDQVLKVGSALVVVDVKSGGHPPDDEERQLATYASGIELAYGIRPKYGTYFMARGLTNKRDETRRYFLPPVTLDAAHHSIAYLTEVYAELDEQIRTGPHMARPSEACRTCGVNDSCAAVGGPLAVEHDPSHPMYRGFPDEA